MSLAIVINVDGVLRAMNNSVITEGLSLFRNLAAENRVFLVSDNPDTRDVLHWLKLNNVRGFVELITAFGMDDSNSRRIEQIRLLRANGATESMLLIDSNPLGVEKCFSIGITSLLFAQPAYMEPQHRPDYNRTPKPWDSLLGEITKQNELRGMDTRLAES